MSEQLLELLKSGSTGLTELAKSGATTLVDETINLYIFFGLMGVLKATIAFVILFILNKFLNSVKDESNAKAVGFGKSALLVVSLVYFTINSFPHLMDIGKAIVAPNVFLIEKGVELVKDVKGK